MQSAMSSPVPAPSKIDSAALTFSLKCELTLQDVPDLIAHVRALCVERCKFVEKIPDELKVAFATTNLKADRARALPFNANLGAEEPSANVVLYGLFGFMGKLRDKYSGAATILNYTNKEVGTSGEAAILTRVNDFVSGLAKIRKAKIPPEFTNIPDARAGLNSALREHFAALGRFGRTAQMALEIRDGAMFLSFHNPVDFNLLAKLTKVQKPDPRKPMGRGNEIVRGFFPTDEGCRYTDLGQKGHLQIEVPLIPPAKPNTDAQAA